MIIYKYFSCHNVNIANQVFTDNLGFLAIFYLKTEN